MVRALPRVAVVVVNFRTPGLVEDCLDALALDPSVQELDLDVVVLDNGSGDDSAERLARRGDCRVVALAENRGFAAGVNAGVAAAHGDPVVVLNSDTRVRPGAIGALVDALAAVPAVGLAAPVLEHPDGTPQPNAYRRLPTPLTVASEVAIAPGYLQMLLPRLPIANVVAPGAVAAGASYAWVMGAAFAVSRSWWERVGPFDEGFFLYFEETDWQRRLRALGGRVEVVADARVEHLLRAGDPLLAVVSPHWVRSARRYLARDGVPTRVAAAWLQGALAVAWLTTWTTSARGGEGLERGREMRRRMRALRRAAVGS